jgi:hypothetical protein
VVPGVTGAGGIEKTHRTLGFFLHASIISSILSALQQGL